MRYVYTTFDTSKHPAVPIESTVLDSRIKSDTLFNDISYFVFYKPGSGLTLKQIEENKAKFREIFDEEVMVNDFKSHAAAFGLKKEMGYSIYDLNIYTNISLLQYQQVLLLQTIAASYKPEPWRKLLANAMVVYQYLEENGIRDNYKVVYPRYSLNTATGRSSTTGFNVQGTTDKFDIRPRTDEYDYLVHFDWLAADIRMIAFMSGDEAMNKSFEKSDPYIMASEYLKDPEFDRERCKNEFIRSVYSLSTEAPILKIFPQFKKWMDKKLTEYERDGCLYSLLGRRYDGDKLRVFNSQFQGSVAHCMQAALVKIYEKYKLNLLTEVHDSIILHCRENRLKEIIREVGSIMLYPLDGWTDNSPRMPVRISVGRKWRQWQQYKVLR